MQYTSTIIHMLEHTIEVGNWSTAALQMLALLSNTPFYIDMPNDMRSY